MKVLEEMLGGHQVSDFFKEWIIRADDETIRASYKVLKRIGLSNKRISTLASLLGKGAETIEGNRKRLSDIGLSGKKIATHAQLLSMNPITIESNYRRLLGLGLSERTICVNAGLLSMNPDTVESNYKRLSNLGLSDKKIAVTAKLLAMSPDTIEKNYQKLSHMGLSDKKIVTLASLLARNPNTLEKNHKRLSDFGLSNRKIAANASLLNMKQETVERKYQNLIGSLRDDYLDRSSGKDAVVKYAWILTMSSSTVEAAIQYLSSQGFNYRKIPILLNSKPQTKRKKLAWILREVFDYRSAGNQKKSTIRNMYKFVRENPKLLIQSIAALEENRKKLREKAQSYVVLLK